MSVCENLQKIQETIEKVCQKVGRNPKEVKVLGAIKAQHLEKIIEAIECGLKLVGENYIQEARERISFLKEKYPGIEAHFIGHLQTNKVKYAIKLFDVIETVDRVSLVDELQKRLSKENKTLDVLIEVKLSSEETKTGCEEKDLESLVEYILEKGKNLNLKGLMTIPPYFEDKEKVRPYFRKLRELRDNLEKKFNIKLPELSMGMSHDFDIAIEEGATIVRIGTLLFGKRQYKKS